MTTNTSPFTAGSNRMHAMGSYFEKSGAECFYFYQYQRSRYEHLFRNFECRNIRRVVINKKPINKLFRNFVRKKKFQIIFLHSDIARHVMRHIFYQDEKLIIWIGRSGPYPKDFEVSICDPRVSLLLPVSSQIAFDLRSSFLSKRKCQRKNVYVIPSCTNINQFRPRIKDKEIVKEFDLSGRKVVGMLAHVRPYKRVEFFLEISKKVTSEVQNVLFIVVGKVSKKFIRIAEKILRRQACVKGNSYIIGNVVFTDLRVDISKILSVFDVSINCSDYYEGVSGAIRESMAMGIPCVASNIGGISDLINDRENGFLVNPADKEMFVKRITEVLRNPSGFKKMGKLARKKVIEEFSQQTLFDKLDKVFGSSKLTN